MPTPKRRKRYSPTEIEAALTTLAFFGGNAARTSEETGIPEDTLRAWRLYDQRDLYAQIQEREGPKLEAIAAGHAREIIIRAATVEHDLLDALSTVAGDPTQSKVSSELAGALQRATTSKGINVTKLLEVTGRPTQIIEHRDPRQEAQALARRLGVAIESTAVEIPSEIPTLATESKVANARETVAVSVSD